MGTHGVDGSPPERKRRRVDSEGGALTNEKEKKLEYNPLTITTPTRQPVAGLTSREAEASCAKWCRVLDDGGYDLDLSRIKCFLSEDERNDRLLVRNVIHGKILSAQVYPLIFETASEKDDDMVRLRSLSFFDHLLANSSGGAPEYQLLDDRQKQIVAIGARDLFLASRHDLLSGRERRVLDGMVKMLEHTLGCAEALGMDISFHPSTNFKVLKFIEDLDESLGPQWSPLFAQVMHTPKLFAVFVDPVELSFHNMENIVPLDRWIEWKLGSKDGSGLDLSLENTSQAQFGREVWTCKLQGAACQLVKQLSLLDLYVMPLNKGTRGGERFIFHSAHLSKALSGAIRSSGLLQHLAHGELASSFEFVNSVFRCNNFAVGDSKFGTHLDTPYYDGGRSQVSKYTLLIYLTGGHSQPALQVGDVGLNDVEEMTCVIFDQRYAHEGRPFEENHKIFIRSELVFTDNYLAHDNQIASLFSEACYMSGQSALDEDLASHAHQCFERANSLHWVIEAETNQPSVYLDKHYQGVRFLTNGYNYWFAKGEGVNLKDCGMIATLDYFNCKFDGKPFRSLCPTTTVRQRFGKTDDIWGYLSNGKKQKATPLKRLQRANVESLLKAEPDKPFVPRPWSYFNSEDDDEEESAPPCCPFHCPSTFNAWEDSETLDAYERCCEYTRAILSGVPLLMLNQDLTINESHIKIAGDKIFFLQESNKKRMPPINFAACWNESVTVPRFLDVDREIPAPELLIPPIIWHEYEQGCHLVLDFFRNDWMTQADEARSIPVPVLTNDPIFEKPTFLDNLEEKRGNPEKNNLNLFAGMEYLDDLYESE